MYLRIIFLILLCIPVIYIFFLLLGYLIDEIIHKEEKKDSHRYDYDEDDALFREYHLRKKRGDYKVIR